MSKKKTKASAPKIKPKTVFVVPGRMPDGEPKRMPIPKRFLLDYPGNYVTMEMPAEVVYSRYIRGRIRAGDLVIDESARKSRNTMTQEFEAKVKPGKNEES